MGEDRQGGEQLALLPRGVLPGEEQIAVALARPRHDAQQLLVLVRVRADQSPGAVTGDRRTGQHDPVFDQAGPDVPVARMGGQFDPDPEDVRVLPPVVEQPTDDKGEA